MSGLREMPESKLGLVLLFHIYGVSAVVFDDWPVWPCQRLWRSGAEQGQSGYNCRVPHQVFKESDKLGFARPLAAKPMLKIIQQVVIVHVGNHVCRNYMF